MEDNIFFQIKSHVSLIKAYFLINGKTVLEYKKSFILQTASMFLNDLIWIFFWWLFFSRFPLINNWTYRDLLILWVFGATGFGLSGLIFGNKNQISELISEGKLDYYLTLPKNVLLHSLTSRMNWFAFGDLLFGLTLALILIPLEQLPLSAICIIVSTLLFVAFGVISGSLAFYLGKSEMISKNVYNMVIGFSIYPTNVYDGITRTILFTILPVGLVAGMPVELLKNFNLTNLIELILISTIFLIISIIIFYAGLKKYESGNQIYVNA